MKNEKETINLDLTDDSSDKKVNSDSLKGLNLMEHGGMNLTMSQATRDNITDLLA